MPIFSEIMCIFTVCSSSFLPFVAGRHSRTNIFIQASKNEKRALFDLREGQTTVSKCFLESGLGPLKAETQTFAGRTRSPRVQCSVT